MPLQNAHTWIPFYWGMVQQLVRAPFYIAIKLSNPDSEETCGTDKIRYFISLNSMEGQIYTKILLSDHLYIPIEWNPQSSIIPSSCLGKHQPVASSKWKWSINVKERERENSARSGPLPPSYTSLANGVKVLAPSWNHSHAECWDTNHDPEDNNNVRPWYQGSHH